MPNQTAPPAWERWLEHLYLDSSCWRTRYAKGHRGHAQFRVAGRLVLVHRFAYTLFVGPIPPGHTIDHVKARGCRFNDCSNPAHLEAVTMRTNVLRGDGLTAQNARKDQCSNGHPFDAANTYVAPNGQRQCRACKRAYDRRQDPARGRERTRRYRERLRQQQPA